MDRKRQPIQLNLDFSETCRGETSGTREQESKLTAAGSEPTSPATDERLMEEICRDENLKEALRRVRANKGAPGVDGMRVDELPRYLERHWPKIRAQLLEGTYKPLPVRRVELPKADGGMRKLGIPTVLDRTIQQMFHLVLEKIWEPTFSEHSYGFRPNRSAHQAVTKTQEYIRQGYHWVVDIDLERFFDQVNQDRLMAKLAARVKDKRVLRVTRAFLNSGVLENGLVSPTPEGTPQGGPLSPLLSNIVLDELDHELEQRGHRFARYADDCNIYVRSERAGARVMESVSRFIVKKLNLKVNQQKSAVDRPARRKFLGFRILKCDEAKRAIAPASLQRFKRRVRQITRRARGVSLQQTILEMATYMKGWRSYYGFCQTPSVLERLEAWIRRRLRCKAWTQWKTRKNRYKRLRALGIEHHTAERAAKGRGGPWSNSMNAAIHRALSKAYFTRLGLPSLTVS